VELLIQLRNVNGNFSRFRWFWIDKIVGTSGILFCKSVFGIKVINVCMVVYRYIDDRLVIFSGREIRTSR
jgi:hypothetical protein